VVVQGGWKRGRANTSSHLAYIGHPLKNSWKRCSAVLCDLQGGQHERHHVPASAASHTSRVIAQGLPDLHTPPAALKLLPVLHPGCNMMQLWLTTPMFLCSHEKFSHWAPVLRRYI
jgi:hypothetical protein